MELLHTSGAFTVVVVVIAQRLFSHHQLVDDGIGAREGVTESFAACSERHVIESTTGELTDCWFHHKKATTPLLRSLLQEETLVIQVSLKLW